MLTCFGFFGLFPTLLVIIYYVLFAYPQVPNLMGDVETSPFTDQLEQKTEDQKSKGGRPSRGGKTTEQGK